MVFLEIGDITHHSSALKSCLSNQVEVFAWSPFGNQLFWVRETFLQIKVASSKILGAMVTKMVATWRVAKATVF